MKFIILYLLAKLRGLFKDKYKANVFCGINTYKESKIMYEKQKWIPYRINKNGGSFISY